MVVFRVGKWSSQIQTEYHVFRPTQDTARFNQNFDYEAITLYGDTFQSLLLFFNHHIAVLQPPMQALGLPSCVFARRY